MSLIPRDFDSSINKMHDSPSGSQADKLETDHNARFDQYSANYGEFFVDRVSQDL
jgi:hypothetical protein